MSKKITWQLKVNENETDLGKVIIEDQLPSGLSCTPEDIAAARIGSAGGLENGSPFDGTDNRFEVGPEGKITITLKDVKTQQYITFHTLVDTGTEAFHSLSQIPFTNSARLQSAANPDWTDFGEVTATLGNKALDKDGVTNEAHRTVAYTVKLNPTGMDLLKGQPAASKLYLTDKLSQGLYLDLDSVKLYKASRRTQKYNNSYTLQLIPGECQVR